MREKETCMSQLFGVAELIKNLIFDIIYKHEENKQYFPEACSWSKIRLGIESNNLSFTRGHSFSTYANFSEKLTFLTL